MENLKFMYNGIKINGKLIKGFWSKGGYRNGALYCFYARSYFTPELAEVFKVRNDSDIMTDYFETDSIFFFESDKYINEVSKAYNLQEVKRAKIAVKRLEKEKQLRPDYFNRYHADAYNRFLEIINAA
jgi:hypothetical protein